MPIRARFKCDACAQEISKFEDTMPEDNQPAHGGPHEQSSPGPPEAISGVADSKSGYTADKGSQGRSSADGSLADGSLADGSLADGSLAGASSDTAPRRGFLKLAAGATMAGGLVAGYGCFAAYAGSFLYPRDAGLLAWQFVATLDDLRVGQSLAYTTPAGATVVVARQSDGDTADDFIALSSVCPHLGCQVHWESQNDRFFCPCHNGAFDSQGRPTEGPPAAAGQSLSRFPLKVEDGLLYIEVPVHSVTGTDRGGVA
jgi:nitrite reductase/ring-hydroxylating ferredoxin subunit